MNVFDFDNTIYDGESAVDMFKLFMKHHPALIKYTPNVVRAVVNYKRGKISIDDVFKDYGGFIEEIWQSMDDVEEILTKEFWQKNGKKIRPFYKDIHTDNDIVVSASPELLLREQCLRMGIKDCIGSQMDLESKKIIFPCFRENKVKAFRMKYPDEVIENFYTDSHNDKAMMDISKNVYLVKKEKITKIK
ncbi:MAG: haloacid dehalogenase-like hydrolase [Clostridiales bacterium]|nr:haloacid dehalogenase-like hydrolase [Clostridiales bacterium]